MDFSLFSRDFFRLEEAEQGIAQALEVAADTVEELSKGSAASQDILESHCKTFLETVKAVQQTLVALGPINSSNKAYQGRAYLSHIEAATLQQQIRLATEQLQAAQTLQAPDHQESTEPCG